MIKYIFLIISFFLLSCNNSDVSNLTVSLSNTIDDNIQFEDYYVSKPFKFIHEIYPKYYEFQLSEYKNIPVGENTYLVTINTDFRNFLYNLNQNLLIDSLKYVELSKRYKIDDLFESKKEIQSQLVAVTGLINGNQFIVVDQNQNKDFIDDDLVYFKYDEENINHNIEDLPLYELEYISMVNDISEKYTRQIKVYPNRNYRDFQRVKDTIARKFGIIAEIQDYWNGLLEIKNEIYDIKVQGYNSKFLEIYLKKNSLEFSHDNFYNNNFKYKLKDTVLISDYLFLIDSISPLINKIFFKKIQPSQEILTGHRLGTIIKNYRLTDLSYEEFFLNDFKSKSYTLLEFWGTWCSPCIKMTPEIKELHKKFPKQLNIIGVAIDNEIEDVQKYVDENDINWNHAFIDITNRNKKSILNDLQIRGYPTYILINNDGFIVHRGGLASFDKIEKILQNKQE